MRRLRVPLLVVIVLLATLLVGRLVAPANDRGAVVVIVVALSIVAALVAGAAQLGTQEHISSGASIVQAFVTSAAIVLAGYFYFVERRDQPHADVSQTVEAVPLGDQNVAIEASVVVKNVGTQALTITHIHSALQAVDLKRLNLSNVPTDPNPYWDESDVVQGKKGRAFMETELLWPQLRIYDGPVTHEIEAGESDLITETFLIPCLDVRYARVATDVTKGTGEKMVWKARSFVDLDPICAENK